MKPNKRNGRAAKIRRQEAAQERVDARSSLPSTKTSRQQREKKEN